MYLIGIHGKARAGKDTLADYLVRQHGFIKQAFATPLKQAGKAMFGLSDEQVFGDELKEVIDPYWGMTPRTMLQKLGTEGGRQVFGEDMWLKRWQKFYLDYSNKSHIVVPDVRFDNEAQLVRSLGGVVIHLHNPNLVSKLDATERAHPSEAGIKFKVGDVNVTNDGNFAQLYAKMSQLMELIKAPTYEDGESPMYKADGAAA